MASMPEPTPNRIAHYLNGATAAHEVIISFEAAGLSHNEMWPKIREAINTALMELEDSYRDESVGKERRYFLRGKLDRLRQLEGLPIPNFDF